MTNLGFNALIYLQSKEDARNPDKDWRQELFAEANLALQGFTDHFIPIIWRFDYDVKYADEMNVYPLSGLIGATSADEPSFWLYHAQSSEGIKYDEPIDDPSSVSVELLTYWAVKQTLEKDLAFK